MILSVVKAGSERPDPRVWFVVSGMGIMISLISAVANAHGLPFCPREEAEILQQSEWANPDQAQANISGIHNVPGTGDYSGPVEVRKGSENPVSRSKDNSGDNVPKSRNQKEGKEKRGAIIIAPLPISSPAIGTGIVPVVGYIFPMDKNDRTTPPSVLGGAGLITNNGSRALALGGNLYLKRGAYQVTSAYVRGHLNYNFYGTGTDDGNAGRKLAITQSGQIFFGEGLRRIGWKFYLGPRVWIARSNITTDLAKSDTDHPTIPDLYLNTDVKAFGARLQRDTRPNRFYPTGGTLFDFTSNFFYVSPNAEIANGTTGNSESVQGNNFSFQTYHFTFNKYASLNKKQVLAYNLFLCAATGEAPFYGQCIFGTNNELRGYVAGRYIDRRMFATQLEYRFTLPKRLGIVAFGGVGEVAPTLAMFRYDNLLSSGGGGVRYKLSTKYHVNLRLDIAQGKNGHT